ncbi:MAG: YbhB/YbcL family Raf kinase inhibitor-like protein [Phycisphaerae bacterium]
MLKTIEDIVQARRTLLSMCTAAGLLVTTFACRPASTASTRPSEGGVQEDADQSQSGEPNVEDVTQAPDQNMEGVPMELVIESSAFSANGPIPVRFTGDGEDVSPPLSWSGVPGDAKELAVIMDDPDAPSRDPWVHWVIYNIPAEVTELPEGVTKTELPPEPSGAAQGSNSWGRIGYGGPKPPSGVHHYHFKLYALDTALGAAAGLDKSGLLRSMQGHIIAQAELVGTYSRQ